ncbi:C2H2 type zinc-finger-domain-containing protein [Mycena sanguinolenta]|nr:C2H2 type zinc-finger-domain-containing protein [Mycena sanguinolenta]
MSAPELFTCLSCTIAFHTAEDQRTHYRSDHHRYNMKRRVAGLPPVSAEVFNQKVLDRRLETAIMSSARGSYCEACNKTYTTENAYRSHINSKKHKDIEAKAKLAPPRVAAEEVASAPVEEMEVVQTLETIPEPKVVSLVVDADASDSEVNQTIDEKIAAARARLSSTSCLFCSHESANLDNNLTHMSTAHSFFVPDAEYLIDIPGLISYLGEKIAVGNVCIYCNGKGREFRTLDATRKHMLDKSHCKIAYDSEDDRLEISDFYDFTSSYPDAETNKSKKKSKSKSSSSVDEEWEDLDDDGESVDETIEDGDEEEDEDDSNSDSDSDVDQNLIRYGDNNLELVLPSGARIGHRNLRRYYPQRFPGSRGKQEDPDSGAALVRRLLADKNSALVPRKGGFGAFGSGTDVVKARNRGEAREAGRHVREFRDQKRREDFKTKVGFIHNSQKHYRDPLLQ